MHSLCESGNARHRAVRRRAVPCRNAAHWIRDVKKPQGNDRQSSKTISAVRAGFPRHFSQFA